MVILPFIPSVPAYDFSTDIEGTAYTFDVRWNSRDKAWYFDVLEADGTPIVYGLKVVLGCFIGSGITHDLFRLGSFIAIDTAAGENQDGIDATLDDMGTRVQLKYVPMAEVIARFSEPESTL